MVLYIKAFKSSKMSSATPERWWKFNAIICVKWICCTNMHVMLLPQPNSDQQAKTIQIVFMGDSALRGIFCGITRLLSGSEIYGPCINTVCGGLWNAARGVPVRNWRMPFTQLTVHTYSTYIKTYIYIRMTHRKSIVECMYVCGSNGQLLWVFEMMVTEVITSGHAENNNELWEILRSGLLWWHFPSHVCICDQVLVPSPWLGDGECRQKLEALRACIQHRGMGFWCWWEFSHTHMFSHDIVKIQFCLLTCRVDRHCSLKRSNN